MAAKMESLGHAVEYYENTEGGHHGSVTNAQLATRLDAHIRMAGRTKQAVVEELLAAQLEVAADVEVRDDEILDLVAYGRDNNIEIRFIEFMPLDATNEWERKKVVTQDEIISVIDAAYPLEILPARGAAPADRWRYVDGKGTVGVIPSVSHPFCADCDRVRLTSDGQFRTCLFATDEFDIRALLRNGGTDDEIAELIRTAVGLKWAGHQINQVNFIRPNRSMSQIGG